MVLGKQFFGFSLKTIVYNLLLRDPLVENSQTSKTHPQRILILAFLWFQRFWHELTNFELVTICTDWSWSLVFPGVLVSSFFGKISCLRENFVSSDQFVLREISTEATDPRRRSLFALQLSCGFTSWEIVVVSYLSEIFPETDTT